MSKNYEVWFTDRRKVEILETEKPQFVAGSNDQYILETEATLVSIGTELTQLEGNVSEDSYWNNSLSWPVAGGYSNVGRVVEVAEGCDPAMIGKRIYNGAPHRKYSKSQPHWKYIFVPDEVSSEEATFTGLGGVALASIRVARIRIGDAVVVYGAGLIGRLVAALAREAGAIKVFVADVSDYRLSLIPDDPCFIRVNTKKEDIITVIRDSNNGRLADIVFETTSLPQLIDSELKCLEKMGKLIITSNPKGRSLVDFDYVNKHAITIIGAINHGSHTPVATPADPWTVERDQDYFLELLQKKKLNVKDMITRRASYKDAVGVYQSLMEDRTRDLGVIFTWED